jgi:hypothetical protein
MTTRAVDFFEASTEKFDDKKSKADVLDDVIVNSAGKS